MHELSLVQSVVRLLEESAREHRIRRIIRVRLVVGRLSAALPDSLRFCWRHLPRGELLADAELEIVEREAEAHCEGCGRSFALGEGAFRCPNCGSSQIRLTGGEELRVDSYEGE